MPPGTSCCRTWLSGTAKSNTFLNFDKVYSMSWTSFLRHSSETHSLNQGSIVLKLNTYTCNLELDLASITAIFSWTTTWSSTQATWWTKWAATQRILGTRRRMSVSEGSGSGSSVTLKTNDAEMNDSTTPSCLALWPWRSKRGNTRTLVITRAVNVFTFCYCCVFHLTFLHFCLR